MESSNREYFVHRDDLIRLLSQFDNPALELCVYDKSAACCFLDIIIYDREHIISIYPACKKCKRNIRKGKKYTITKMIELLEKHPEIYFIQMYDMISGLPVLVQNIAIEKKDKSIIIYSIQELDTLTQLTNTIPEENLSVWSSES